LLKVGFDVLRLILEFNEKQREEVKGESVWSRLRLKITEKVANEVLSIPMHPRLTKREVEYVSDKVKESLEARK
jgi:dTDP-4-amino-4,6-dideoxygalactose transaminase